MRDAVARVRHDLDHLIGALPSEESQLFEAEAHTLDEIELRLLARGAAGQQEVEAIVAETSCGCTDLVIDLRVRLLSALYGSASELDTRTVHRGDDVVLVTDVVTPSLVRFASRVHCRDRRHTRRAADARRDVGRTSHAAILARGRGCPSRVAGRGRGDRVHRSGR